VLQVKQGRKEKGRKEGRKKEKCRASVSWGWPRERGCACVRWRFGQRHASAPRAQFVVILIKCMYRTVNKKQFKNSKMTHCSCLALRYFVAQGFEMIAAQSFAKNLGQIHSRATQHLGSAPCLALQRAKL
jgi:hypothetical protein